MPQPIHLPLPLDRSKLDPHPFLRTLSWKIQILESENEKIKISNSSAFSVRVYSLASFWPTVFVDALSVLLMFDKISNFHWESFSAFQIAYPCGVTCGSAVLWVDVNECGSTRIHKFANCESTWIHIGPLASTKTANPQVTPHGPAIRDCGSTWVHVDTLLETLSFIIGHLLGIYRNISQSCWLQSSLDSVFVFYWFRAVAFLDNYLFQAFNSRKFGTISQNSFY